jgi:type I restriction enzyme R subunit
VATVELKTDFTQSMRDAIDQYRFDRTPRPKGQAAEPLLSFPRGALVHFAVSNREGGHGHQGWRPGHRFLPFNLGDDGAPATRSTPTAATAPPTCGSRCGQRDSWLEILGRYLIAQRDRRRRSRKVIFPRYHQLDVTRKLQAAVLADGPGGKYLIQHSAGRARPTRSPGRRTSWPSCTTPHTRSCSTRAGGVGPQRDRRAAAGGALRLPAHHRGGRPPSRATGAAARAASWPRRCRGKKIVVCTIQTFPFALEGRAQLAATEGKRFAVIADEAHSSRPARRRRSSSRC